MKNNIVELSILALSLAIQSSAGILPKKKPPQPAALDKYAIEAAQQAQDQSPTEGSLWTPLAQFADLGRDLKASQVNDLVTIVVSEQASAVSSGATQTSRKTSVAASVTGLVGVKSAASALANLANTSNDTELNGSGTTSRNTAITTTMSARVTKVLPNGYMLLEGTKNVQVNSDYQTITVRGIVRPADLASDNSVPSNRLAQMEVTLDGKGVIVDAIHRPNILYRVLLGLLPF
jgi:flagellar L-ring protein FlgH